MKDLLNLEDDELGRQAGRAMRELPDAPAAWQRAAQGLWTKRMIEAGVQAVVKRIAAVLSFDSWTAPGAALAVRSGASSTRHLLFTAQGRDIDLRIAPTPHAYSVAGQILGPDELGMVELVIEDASGRAAHVTHLDALGEFSIQGVRSGTYVMTLRMGAEEIVLPAVEVGEQVS